MNSQPQIQIHFPYPGEWQHFLLTSLWEDAEGFCCRRTYQPEDLSAQQLHILEESVATLVQLEAPWQATHVIATLRPAEDDAGAEAIHLSLNARRPDGASRIFTPADYPQLQLSHATAVRLFRQMTGMEAE